MLKRYKDFLFRTISGKFKNQNMIQKIKDSKATIILLTLIVGIILTRTFFYIADSKIVINEKVAEKTNEKLTADDEEEANYLSLGKINSSIENESEGNTTDQLSIETQEINTENHTQLDGSSQDHIKTGQAYIFSASLNKYFSLNEFNEFTIEDLKNISGIGEVTASAILAYREEHGPFQSFSELQEIKGIGEKKLKKWIIIGP